MKTRFCGVLASASILTLAACGSPKPTASATAPPGGPAVASPSPTATGPLKLGTARTFTYPTWSARVTVYAYRQPLRSQFPPQQHGTTYVGADVKYCNLMSAGQNTSVSWAPWSLGFKDDTSIDSVTEWSPEWFSVPLYPAVGKTVPVGRCVRGWVLFAAPKGKRPARIAYSPQAEDGPVVPVTEWSVR
jgi:hypothetical protein